MIKKRTIILLSSMFIATGGVCFALAFSNASSKYKKSYMVSFNTDGGSPIKPILVEEGAKIPKLTNPSKNGYLVKCWNYGDNEWKFDEFTINHDMTLTTIWAYHQYDIIYQTEGGTLQDDAQFSYNIESEFLLPTPSRDGSVFVGWIDQSGNIIHEITQGTTGTLILTAKWLDNLTVINLDESKGTITISYIDDSVYLQSIPKNHRHHLFKGWYDANDELLSTNETYSFVLDKNIPTTIYSKYLTKDEEDNWNLQHGVLPTIKNNTVVFGMYPRSVVNDESIIFALDNTDIDDELGYYYYNSEYYYKRQANLYRNENTGELLDSYEFDNGTEIVEGKDYWFKVEPIEWQILNEEDGFYKLLSTYLIDVVKFYPQAQIREIDGLQIYPNNYQYSTLRSWLNNDFLKLGFFFCGNCIKETEIDNSSETTISLSNDFCCSNTKDKVYQLSYAEYYAIDSSTKRKFLTTDLSRASQALFDTSMLNQFRGYTWTRSPHPANEFGYSVSRLNCGGGLNYCWVGANYSCAQPCITLDNI